MQEKEERTIQCCRFYQNEYPEQDDLVVVEVVNIEENASYVSLLEYNRIEGMITPNELTQAMKQSVQKALKLGKKEVVRVLRVDSEKGYIDLSKRKVPKNEELLCLDKFAKSSTCNAIMISITEKTKDNMQDLYEQILWPLYDKYSHPYEALSASINDPSIIESLAIKSDEVRKLLISEIQRRLQPQNVRVKTEFELTCYGPEGVDAIRKALKAGETLSENNQKIKFFIVGSPVYSGYINTSDKNRSIKILKAALDKIKQEITSFEGGKFKLKAEPKVFGEKRQEELEALQQEDDDEFSGSEVSDVSGMGGDDDEEED